MKWPRPPLSIPLHQLGGGRGRREPKRVPKRTETQKKEVGKGVFSPVFVSHCPTPFLTRRKLN